MSDQETSAQGDEFAEDIEVGPNGVDSEDEMSIERSQESGPVRHLSESRSQQDDDDDDDDGEGGEAEYQTDTDTPSVPDCCTTPCCGGSGSSGFGSGSGDLDINSLVNTISALLPTLLPLFSGSGSSGPGWGQQKSGWEDLYSQWETLWCGLDQISNPQIRAICFIDRLNKFHDYFWDKCPISSTSGEPTAKSTAASLIRSQLRSEITNVMEQLTK